MTRPRTDNGGFVPAAHKRLPWASTLELIAVRIFADDRRLCHLEAYRRLALARRAVDNAVDGDAPPPAVFREDPADKGHRPLADAWHAAVAAVKAEHARRDREVGDD